MKSSGGGAAQGGSLPPPPVPTPKSTFMKSSGGGAAQGESLPPPQLNQLFLLRPFHESGLMSAGVFCLRRIRRPRFHFEPQDVPTACAHRWRAHIGAHMADSGVLVPLTLRSHVFSGRALC